MDSARTPTTTPVIESLSAELHALYQQEARRQAGTGEDTVRHPDDYASLPEHTKEYDRVLARFILAREEAFWTLLKRIDSAALDIDEWIDAQRRASR